MQGFEQPLALASYDRQWGISKWYQILYNFCIKSLKVHSLIMAMLIVQALLMCCKPCHIVLRALILGYVLPVT